MRTLTCLPRLTRGLTLTALSLSLSALTSCAADTATNRDGVAAGAAVGDAPGGTLTQPATAQTEGQPGASTATPAIGDEGNQGADSGGFGGAPANFDACAATSFAGETTIRPVDIIWAIDSSGSMRGEADIVQANMNQFVSDISGSGIEDYRVVVITEEGFVEVPAPLGNDPSVYRFVDQNISSGDPLKDTLNTFPMYRDFLRDDAVTHVIIVTDDNERGLLGPDFVSQYESQLGHEVIVHAIASEPGGGNQVCDPFFGTGFCVTPGCSGPNGSATSAGVEHYAAADTSGGLTFSICTEDWSSLFTTLADEVGRPEPVACLYLVPEPEVGDTLDPNKVNVVYTSGDLSSEQAIRRVDSGNNCSQGGWYYDNPGAPSEILLCPGTCDTLEADIGAMVDIALGCDTIIL